MYTSYMKQVNYAMKYQLYTMLKKIDEYSL